MKKTKTILNMVIALTLISTTLTSISAATTPPEGSSVIKTEDGTEIIYDNNAINGGINEDIDTKINNKKVVSRAEVAGKSLNVKHQTQQNNYYCGPASASMIVKYLGYNKSQSYMANLLKTNESGTGAGKDVAGALNKVASAKAKFTWEWHNYSDVNKIKNHIKTAIDYGNPVMINTMESPGDVYLKGHNTGYTLYHYGVVSGYSNFANNGIYLDPAYGRLSGFVKQQMATMKDLSYASGGRGYAW